MEANDGGQSWQIFDDVTEPLAVRTFRRTACACVKLIEHHFYQAHWFNKSGPRSRLVSSRIESAVEVGLLELASLPTASFAAVYF